MMYGGARRGGMSERLRYEAEKYAGTDDSERIHQCQSCNSTSCLPDCPAKYGWRRIEK